MNTVNVSKIIFHSVIIITGTKPSTEPLLIIFIGACMRIQASMVNRATGSVNLKLKMSKNSNYFVKINRTSINYCDKSVTTHDLFNADIAKMNWWFIHVAALYISTYSNWKTLLCVAKIYIDLMPREKCGIKDIMYLFNSFKPSDACMRR